jgi:hypothetical protein
MRVPNLNGHHRIADYLAPGAGIDHQLRGAGGSEQAIWPRWRLTSIRRTRMSLVVVSTHAGSTYRRRFRVPFTRDPVDHEVADALCEVFLG